jgi:hypothetical protein
MTDLATRIRERLDEWQQPTGIIETPKELSREQYDDLVRRFKAAQLELNEVKVIPFPPSADARMRNALVAVLELHAATDDGSGYRTVCGVCCGPSESWERLALPWPCPTVRAVATALGIEET